MSNKIPSLWEYLDNTGVLENGSEAEIKQAKQEYRRLYQRAYKQERRKSYREFTVSLSPKEFRTVKMKARQHNISISRFIKQSCLAYINCEFLVPDQEKLARLEQYMSFVYTDITNMVEYGGDNKYRLLVERLEKMERFVIDLFRGPILLIEEIKTRIRSNPDFRNLLRKVLYDNKD